MPVLDGGSTPILFYGGRPLLLPIGNQQNLVSSMLLRGNTALWLALAIATAAWCVACGEAASDRPMRIAVVGPLAEGYGARVLRGAELARSRINEDGGVRNRLLEMAAFDDAADPRRALAIADSLYADASILAVVGHVNSSTALASANTYNRGLVAVSPSATSPQVSRAGPWIFRVAPSDEANSASLARFALRELGSRAAVLYANDSYGRGLREGFAQAFLDGGGRLPEQYPYLEGETRDFEPYLLGIADAGIDLIFIAGLDAGAGTIIRQARALGIRVPVLGGDGLAGLAGRAEVYEGTYLGLLYHPDVPGMVGRRFVEAYESVYREAPDHFAALGYDAVMLVQEALREVGSDRSGIRDYLEEIGRRRGAYLGVTGTIAFDEHGDPVGKGYAVGRISGGSIELVTVEDGS